MMEHQVIVDCILELWRRRQFQFRLGTAVHVLFVIWAVVLIMLKLRSELLFQVIFSLVNFSLETIACIVANERRNRLGNLWRFVDMLFFLLLLLFTQFL